MLSSRFRISRKDWDAAIAGTRSFRLQNLQVRIKTSDAPRFGVVVSKKVSKLSVRRHEIKRYIYRWVQNSADRIGNRTMVIFITKDRADMDDYGRELESLLYEVSQ
jgi:ribonuclease P protein component